MGIHAAEFALLIAWILGPWAAPHPADSPRPFGQVQVETGGLYPERIHAWADGPVLDLWTRDAVRRRCCSRHGLPLEPVILPVRHDPDFGRRRCHQIPRPPSLHPYASTHVGVGEDMGSWKHALVGSCPLCRRLRDGQLTPP
jgi:hypothetical protein